MRVASMVETMEVWMDENKVGEKVVWKAEKMAAEMVE